MTSVQRTMRELRQRGVKCAVVEKWNQFSNRRQDLFGIIDILALDPERGFIGVQVCTGSAAGHRKKMMQEKAQECLDWLSTPGGILELWCWRKVKAKRGGTAMVWKPKIEEITCSSLQDRV